MHKIKLSFTALSALIFLLLSCGKEDAAPDGVSFSVDVADVVADAVKSKVSDYTSKPSSSDFVLTVKNSSEETVWTGKLSEWSSSTPLAVGDYTVSAVYGTEGTEGFDLPHYAGTASFSINGGAATKVNIPAKLSNCIVKFSFTDSFKSYYPKYDFVVKTGSSNEISFPQSETRAAFVDAFKITVSGNLVNQGNSSSTFGPKTYDALSEATCYTVKFDVTNAGGLKLTVSFNDVIDSVDLGTIEIGE